MNNIESTRKKDTKVEYFVNNWLSRFYFDKIFDERRLITNTAQQVAGIDLIGDGVKYDIKTQASKKYLCNPTNTFIAELSFLNKNGKESIGWFLNDKLETNSYIFVWIHDCIHEDGIIFDIAKAEVMIVNKCELTKAVLKEYYSNSYQNNSLFELSNTLRATNQTPVWVGKLKFVYSAHLFEQPVNIVLKKDFLRKYATRYDMVTKARVESII